MQKCRNSGNSVDLHTCAIERNDMQKEGRRNELENERISPHPFRIQINHQYMINYEWTCKFTITP